MKKKSGFLIALILLCVSVFLSIPLKNNISRLRLNREIEQDKPSQEELTEFYSYLEKDTYFYYNNLNDDEKDAYKTMYVALMDFEESFFLSATKSNLKDIFMAVLYDNPHIFWVKNNYIYTEYDNAIMFYPEYRHSADTAEKITNQLNKKIDEIISEVELLPSEYEKELYIHNYVCENTEYDLNSGRFTDTAYEAILNGKAVCEGYSRAIQMLLNAVDIDNYLIVGNGISDGRSEPHMWNIVNIDNANYHLDATWNDSGITDKISYFYFNVTDEYIMDDHTDLNITSNSCIYDTANYFVMENARVSKYNGFNYHIGRSAVTLKNGNNSVEFYFDNTDDFNQAVYDIETDNDFFKYISSTVYQSGRNLDAGEVEYYIIDKYNYLCIVFKER